MQFVRADTPFVYNSTHKKVKPNLVNDILSNFHWLPPSHWLRSNIKNDYYYVIIELNMFNNIFH